MAADACPARHPQAAEVHKTATLVSLQSCRSHPSTTLKPQRVVLQNPEAPPGSASAAQQASHALVQRSFKLVEVNGWVGSRGFGRWGEYVEPS